MSQHSLCESPHCPLCRTETPILCDEIKIDDKFIIKTTQRERDLAKIVIFFYDKCKDDIVGVSRGYTDHHQGRAIHMADSRIH